MRASLDEAFADLLRALDESSAFLQSHGFFEEPEDRARAYLFLTSVLIARLEETVIIDADFPYFRVIDRRTGEGADSPDQRYLVAPVRGGATYRIWGTIGSARRLEFQIYAGDPYLDDGGGRNGSFLTFEELTVGDDGKFEVFLSPRRTADKNWLENPADATKLMVRQIYSEWSDDDPGEVHIDRVGSEGELAPPIGEDELAGRFRAAASSVRSHTRIWPQIVERILASVPPNELGVPRDSRDAGGVPGRWMVNGSFNLADDEALIVRIWPVGGNYLGIQLLDLWMKSLEYANRQTSLTADQAHRSADGSYWFVIASRDPGVANWLDTVGRRRGLIIVRYDGTGADAFDEARRPTTTKVRLMELKNQLPADTVFTTQPDRTRALAARRKHVQVRFGN